MRIAFLVMLSYLSCAGPALAQGNPLDLGRGGPSKEREIYYGQVRKQVNDLLIRWQHAWESNDAAALATLYADGASYYPPASGPVPTRNSIRDHFANFLGTVGDARVQMMDFGTSGDLAYATGRISYQIQTATGENRQLSRTDLFVLRRRSNDHWLIQMHFSRDEPEMKPAH
jgi:uncharacterized protein (TIGR02246 family)